MKPEKIFLIRHGESESNVDKTILLEKPDYAINLTPKGREQAFKAGEEISKLINFPHSRLNHIIRGYVSPFYRTRQTYAEIAKSFGPHLAREDVRLIEQEWTGYLRPEGFDATAEEERDAYGHFYYRFQGGESCADVYNRVTTFLDTFHRDFEKENFPRNCIIVTHGMTLRVLLMRWFHLTVEEFEILRNPKNCQYYILELQADNKYKLITPLEKHEKRNCIY